MRRFALPIVLALWGTACSVTTHTQSAHTTEAERHVAWQSTLDLDNPLVGRIWDVSQRRFVGERELRDAVVAARVVLIGEQHDNPDHHVLQARLLGELVSAGQRPAVVFEMIDVDKQPLVAQARRAHPDDPQALARALDWEHSGWPAFPLYRPVFARALRARLPILGAGIDRSAATRIVHQGVSALPNALVRTFALDQPLAPDLLAKCRQEMAEVHCGLLPPSMLDGMVLVQRARDAYLAERLHAGIELAGRAVLIAGSGHVRDDRGVPTALAAAYGTSALAIGLVEVEDGVSRPERYAANYDARRLPFGYVWFTPRANDVDHCKALRESMAHRPHPMPHVPGAETVEIGKVRQN